MPLKTKQQLEEIAQQIARPTARAEMRKLKRGLRAYAVVIKALEPLDNETRARVLRAAAVLTL